MVKIKKHAPSLKTVYKSLNRKEPFTSTEKNEFSIREQNLIRGIQLKDKKSKGQAIDKFRDYKLKGKTAVKRLSTSIRKYNKTKYPKTGGKIEHDVDEFEKPKPKTKIKAENKTKVKKYLSNKNNKYKNEKRYKRILNASKKYKNAGMFELDHGVNSKVSQEWRLRHGLNRDYK